MCEYGSNNPRIKYSFVWVSMKETCVPTRLEKYWAESGRGDRQGDVEKEDQQSYRRHYMMGKAMGKEDTCVAFYEDRLKQFV